MNDPNKLHVVRITLVVDINSCEPAKAIRELDTMVQNHSLGMFDSIKAERLDTEERP